ncbi:MAG: GLPGLI family protein [Flavobacteriaceae bacterium]|jgi:GLPGLI family protein|nr:GLPGLI family protein [Flavobacteriaceae bacterium]
MKKKFIIFQIFIFGFISAQKYSFTYEMKYKPNPDKDSVITQNMVLDVSGLKSVFRSELEKKNDSSWISSGKIARISTSLEDNFYVSKNLETGETYKYISQMFNNYMILIDEKPVWKLLNETKKENEFMIQKSQAEYGERIWTAWFTTEIPLQEGPYVFCGLPGLITEISDSSGDYHFTLVEIKKSDGKLYEKQKPLKINWEQYQKLFLSYYSDPTGNINGKNVNSTVNIDWKDEKGIEVSPDFREMNEREQKQMRENNNPVELNHKISFK